MIVKKNKKQIKGHFINNNNSNNSNKQFISRTLENRSVGTRMTKCLEYKTLLIDQCYT